MLKWLRQHQLLICKQNFESIIPMIKYLIIFNLISLKNVNK
jgi:hypothetical protein